MKVTDEPEKKELVIGVDRDATPAEELRQKIFLICLGVLIVGGGVLAVFFKAIEGRGQTATEPTTAEKLLGEENE